MKKTFRYSALLIGTLILIKITSCEPEDWITVNCNDCYSYKPDSADLIINLTINAANDSVPIVVYKGKLEEGAVDWEDIATEEEFRLYSEVGQLYTVKVTYVSGSETIIAIDADKMTIVSADEECGYPCYIVKGGIYDLSLLDE